LARAIVSCWTMPYIPCTTPARRTISQLSGEITVASSASCQWLANIAGSEPHNWTKAFSSAWEVNCAKALSCPLSLISRLESSPLLWSS
jgi:hypothetical protein